ncbi:hypothetical protein GUJ93_ZPchr0002g25843 [Zizania palustris]|uniref:Uncharacterized protein n=1 Tax=Zizania palustris TaxID=103762 RepID=A0A8J5VEQ6_ZIZPA|nr:hypothetical protein GUJ93_ZPchr0002g25843 [Zizania palustris]
MYAIICSSEAAILCVCSSGTGCGGTAAGSRLTATLVGTWYGGKASTCATAGELQCSQAGTNLFSNAAKGRASVDVTR